MHVAGHKQRPPLHHQEKWFLGLVLIQLIFMPWAFGTMHGWSQASALGLGISDDYAAFEGFSLQAVEP